MWRSASEQSVSESKRSLTRRFLHNASPVANMRRGAGPSPRGTPEVSFPAPPHFPLYPPFGENGSPCARRLLAVAHAPRGANARRSYSRPMGHRGGGIAGKNHYRKSKHLQGYAPESPLTLAHGGRGSVGWVRGKSSRKPPKGSPARLLL